MHAYLIMAHNNFYVLEKLLQMIDDYRNDIYIHIDRKVRLFNFDYYSQVAKKSKVTFVNRIDVTWGEYSQVECEMILMKAACHCVDYDFVHLLSGTDLPLKPQEEIHRFFNEHKGKLFLHTASVAEVENELWKLRGYAIEREKKFRILYYLLNNIFLEKVCHYSRLKKYDGLVFAKSANWYSLPGECVKYIVSKERFIRKLTNHTVCGDEFFLATVLINSEYWDNIYQLENDRGHMRYIDWKNRNGNSPKILTVDDYDIMIDSGMLWARKFDENVDIQVIKKLYEYVMGK